MSKKNKTSFKNATPYELLHTEEGFEKLKEEGLVEPVSDSDRFYSVDFCGILKRIAADGGKDPGSWFKDM